MNVFRQKRNLITTIVILVIINFITLLLLWIGKPKHDLARGSETMGHVKVGIQEMLKKELGFSKEQTEQFLTLRESHKEKTTGINEKIMQLRKEMFEDAMYSDNLNISDSLLTLSLEKQGKIEKLTFEYLQKLKQICTHEQEENLFELMHNLLGPPPGENPNGPPPRGRRDGSPPEEGREGPPPGEMREGRPPPPPGDHSPRRD